MLMDVMWVDFLTNNWIMIVIVTESLSRAPNSHSFEKCKRTLSIIMLCILFLVFVWYLLESGK